MADVITRFKLETTQYDSKLRDAAKGLSELSRQVAAAGGDFNKLNKSSVDIAKSFGSISTSATNSKDKVKELVTAFNDVARAYNNMTKEQQSSDFGKAMAASMQQLKSRITEAKQDMNSTGGVLGQLKDKFTINIDAIKLFNVGLTAAKAALDVAKDAFFASEANVDEWGRTMASAKGLYEGFLNALNTGDISGYLSNMDDIVLAARQAYNAIDTLKTMQTIQSPQFSKQEAENTRMRTMLMTGRWISAGDGRQAPYGLKDGDVLSPGMLKRIEQQLKNGMNTIVSLTKNEIKQTGKAIDDYYNSLAKQNGMSLKEFREGTSSWKAFSQKMAGYQAYKDWDKQARIEFARQGGRGYVNFDKNNPYAAEFKKWGVFRVDKMGENSFNELVGYIKQQSQQQQQLYSAMGQAYKTINRAEGITVKRLMNPVGSGGGSGSGSGKGGGIVYPAYSMNAVDVSTLNLPELAPKVVPVTFEVDTTGMNALQQLEAELQNLIDQQKVFGGQSSEMWQTYQQLIDETTKKIDTFKGKSGSSANNKNKSEENDLLKDITDPLNKVNSGISQIAGGIQQLGVDIPEGLTKTLNAIQGISSILVGISSLMTVITTIQGVKATPIIGTFLANGGVLKAASGTVVGNTYSGDQVGPVMLDAGEVVLNRAQAGALASSLRSGDRGGGYTPSRITGEQIWIAVNRYTKRTGRGELVTWK